MSLLKHLQFNTVTFKPNRAVFQGADQAPPSPENFTNNEKQSQADAVNEVGQQSASQIKDNAVTKAGIIQAKYTKNTKLLANLINDPVTGQLPPAGGNPVDQKPDSNQPAA